jgi:hypothetical protein
VGSPAASTVTSVGSPAAASSASVTASTVPTRRGVGPPPIYGSVGLSIRSGPPAWQASCKEEAKGKMGDFARESVIPAKPSGNPVREAPVPVRDAPVPFARHQFEVITSTVSRQATATTVPKRCGVGPPCAATTVPKQRGVGSPRGLRSTFGQSGFTQILWVVVGPTRFTQQLWAVVGPTGFTQILWVVVGPTRLAQQLWVVVGLTRLTTITSSNLQSARRSNFNYVN